MSNIKLEDFTKSVELGRRRLIKNIREKGKVIDDNASLEQVIAINNSIGIIEDESQKDILKYEVRFFDVDGTLLKSEWVELGGSVTPPDSPNIDPERLTFDRWCSAIGDTFDNITHDVDYCASYKTFNSALHLFLNINESTGYEASSELRLSKGSAVTSYGTITVDWGDGTIEEFKPTTNKQNLNHTYSADGEYEIIIKNSNTYQPDSSRNDYFYTYLYGYQREILSGKMMNAVTKMYFPIAHCRIGGNNVKYVVYESLTGSNNDFIVNMKNVNCILLKSNKKITNIKYFNMSYPNISKHLIFDKSLENSTYMDKVADIGYLYSLDKLIIPNVKFNINSIQGYNCKLIILGQFARQTYTASLYGVTSLHILSPINYIPRLTSCYKLSKFEHREIGSIVGIDSYLLKEFIIPSNCEVNINAFEYNHSMQFIGFYADFDYSLNFSDCYSLTDECLVDMLNHVKDNTGLAAKTFVFNNIILARISFLYVKLNNGIYEKCDRLDENAIKIVEAFSNKNWTIS